MYFNPNPFFIDASANNTGDEPLGLNKEPNKNNSPIINITLIVFYLF